MFNITKRFLLTVLIGGAAAVTTTGANAQTTESLTVSSIAPDSPAWMAELATAEDFREPGESDKISAQPYGDAGKTATANTALPTGHQPSGALSGKVIFTMAGHGWTYDADRMIYYTQRGLSHGMVEDIGNADQMHIFAHLVFNSGATVVPLRPVDHQPNERIIDNSMPQVEFYGDWRAGTSDRYFGEKSDKVPYAVASSDLLESALARYRPYIPETGYYPVYVWATDGDDRSNQLYRVIHSGGTTEVRVNWRQIGKAWVWLGTYHFNEGDSGYVEISNQVIDPYEAYNNHVVVADAVRFGNGHGDVPRPGGISGFGREDEGDSYWIERSLGVGADRRIFDVGRDGSSTVSSPPKAAAHINRETFGSYLDRLLISFHSNASTGKARGTVALYNASPARRPSYQELLAELIGNQLNTQMRAETSPEGVVWSDRERNTYSGINFGELRRDYVQNEMAATIVESAFHDNAEDVKFLLDPKSRIEMSEATLKGIFDWYSQIKAPKAVATMAPVAPEAISATIRNGRIHVKWKQGPVGQFDGGTPANFRLYRSSNGYGFDGGTPAAPDSDTITVDPLTTDGVTFLRLTALNEAGESFPSQTIAVSPSWTNDRKTQVTPKTLFLVANTVLDSTTNVPYYLGRQVGGPYRDTSYTERVRALYTMLEPSGAAEAMATAASNIGFDSADIAAFADGMIETKDYDRIILTSDQQNPNSQLLPQDTIASLRTFVNGGGKLLVTGSGLAQNLEKSGKPGRDLLSGIFGVTGTTTQLPGSSINSLDDRFFSTTRTISLQTQSRPWAMEKQVHPAEFEIREGRSLGLLRYDSPQGEHFAAALTRPGYSEGEVLVLGFPLGLIPNEADRTALMGAMLKQL